MVFISIFAYPSPADNLKSRDREHIGFMVKGRIAPSSLTSRLHRLGPRRSHSLEINSSAELKNRPYQ